MTAETVTAAATQPDARLEAVIERINRLFGPSAGDMAQRADHGRHDPFAFRDAMSLVEREVYGR